MNFKEMTDDQLWDYLGSLKDAEGVTQDPTGQGHLAHVELMSRPNSFRIRTERVDWDIEQALSAIENIKVSDRSVA
jgi:hypothetical protein